MLSHKEPYTFAIALFRNSTHLKSYLKQVFEANFSNYTKNKSIHLLVLQKRCTVSKNNQATYIMLPNLQFLKNKLQIHRTIVYNTTDKVTSKTFAELTNRAAKAAILSQFYF